MKLPQEEGRWGEVKGGGRETERVRGGAGRGYPDTK